MYIEQGWMYKFPFYSKLKNSVVDSFHFNLNQDMDLDQDPDRWIRFVKLRHLIRILQNEADPSGSGFTALLEKQYCLSFPECTATYLEPWDVLEKNPIGRKAGWAGVHSVPSPR